jgi:hypothetical protein
MYPMVRAPRWAHARVFLCPHMVTNSETMPVCGIIKQFALARLVAVFAD